MSSTRIEILRAAVVRIRHVFAVPLRARLEEEAPPARGAPGGAICFRALRLPAIHGEDVVVFVEMRARSTCNGALRGQVVAALRRVLDRAAVGAPRPRGSRASPPSGWRCGRPGRAPRRDGAARLPRWASGRCLPVQDDQDGEAGRHSVPPDRHQPIAQRLQLVAQAGRTLELQVSSPRPASPSPACGCAGRAASSESGVVFRLLLGPRGASPSPSVASYTPSIMSLMRLDTLFGWIPCSMLKASCFARAARSPPWPTSSSR